MSARRLVPLVLAAVAVAFWVVERGRDPAPAPQAGAVRTTTVLRVVDGDTIVVRAAGGGSERVRYIGIDTPESVEPGTPVQCWAKRAGELNDELIGGRRVRLVIGAEPRDRYGRTLAYVYREPDGLFVNAELLRRGAARTLTIAPNDRYAGRFAALAADARRAGRGLWSAC
ncbi:MAG TPA: thermonuclease family protein [Solirubrobacteraceae bacterium]|nr:thermonuclease family protein [Solirubrobacteraceae bacterium]